LDKALQVLDQQREAREAEQRAARQDFEDRRQERLARGTRPTGGVPAGMEVELAEEAVAQEEQRAAAQAKAQDDADVAAAAEGRKRRGGSKPHPDGPRDLRAARRRLERARNKAEERAAKQGAAEEPDRANTTDPDSRIMKTQQGWVQGYNAQAAVNEDGIVLAAHVTQEGNDVQQCQPMMTATQANLEAAGVEQPIGTMVFDAGYLSEENITAQGPSRLIATGKANSPQPEGSAKGRPINKDVIREMDKRLRTKKGRATYAKRQHTVEPVFGELKHLRGFRRFSRRGIDAVNAEWTFMTLAHNTLKLFRHDMAVT
jgi:hypothetical protein